MLLLHNEVKSEVFDGTCTVKKQFYFSLTGSVSVVVSRKCFL